MPFLDLKYHFWFGPPSGLNLDLNLTPPLNEKPLEVSSSQVTISIIKLILTRWLWRSGSCGKELAGIGSSRLPCLRIPSCRHHQRLPPIQPGATQPQHSTCVPKCTTDASNVHHTSIFALVGIQAITSSLSSRHHLVDLAPRDSCWVVDWDPVRLLTEQNIDRESTSTDIPRGQKTVALIWSGGWLVSNPPQFPSTLTGCGRCTSLIQGSGRCHQWEEEVSDGSDGSDRRCKVSHGRWFEVAEAPPAR